MKNTYSDLDLVAGMTAITALLLLVLPQWNSPVRVLLGLFLVLYAPGYALYTALFPTPQHRLEQVVLTLVLSMIATAAIGLILNYTVGLTLPALAVGLGGLTLGTLGVTAWRRGRNPSSTVDVSRTWLLGVAAALVLLTGLSWGAQQRQPIEASTEFYLFGRAGQLAEYPDRVPPNQRLPLFLAINNIEGRDLQYRVRGGFNTERRDLQTASVSKGQEWKAPLEVSAPSEPGKHTLTLDLYRPSDTQPYRQLTLTVTVQ